MEQDALHLPDFGVPDTSQPALERVDLAQADFTLPDPALSPLRAGEALRGFVDLDRPETDGPDPTLPDLLGPDRPALLSYPSADTHILPEPEYAPEVVMRQRPGELDSSAQTMMLSGPDAETLPPGLSYPQLYTDDEMTRRKRHFAMLEFGLEGGVSESHDE